MLIPTEEQIQSEFFALIEDIPKKNKGGCLFFCYLFYKWLEKNEFNTNRFSIVQYDSGTDSIRTNLDYLNGNSNHAGSSAHFTWRYNGTHYDSDGVFEEADTRYWQYNRATLEIGDMDDFCEDALNYGGWNWEFQRGEAVDIVYERFGISLYNLC